MAPHRLAKQQHKHTRKSFWGTISERSIAVLLKGCRHRRAEIRGIARPSHGLHNLQRYRCSCAAGSFVWPQFLKILHWPLSANCQTRKSVLLSMRRLTPAFCLAEPLVQGLRTRFGFRRDSTFEVRCGTDIDGSAHPRYASSRTRPVAISYTAPTTFTRPSAIRARPSGVSRN